VLIALEVIVIEIALRLPQCCPSSIEGNFQMQAFKNTNAIGRIKSGMPDPMLLERRDSEKLLAAS
jgi:hypothetical protein